MKKALLVFFLLGTIGVSAQTGNRSIEWKKIYPDSSFLGARSVVSDRSGYVITESIQPGNTGLPKGHLKKIDSAGNVIWESPYISNLEANVVGKTDKGFIIAGVCYIPVMVNGMVWNLAQIKIVSTDANGDLLWTKVYPAKDSLNSACDPSLQVLNSGKNESYIILTGATDIFTYGQKPYVFSISNDGSMLWNHIYDLGYYYQMPYDKLKPVAGGYVFSVNSYSTVAAYLNSDIDKYALVKITQGGDSVWKTTIPDFVQSYNSVKATGNIVLATDNGNIFVDNAIGRIVATHSNSDYSRSMVYRTTQSSEDDNSMVEAFNFTTMFPSGAGTGSMKIQEKNGTGAINWILSLIGTSDTSYCVRDIISTPDGGYLFCGNILTNLDGSGFLTLNRSFLAKIGGQNKSLGQPQVEINVKVYPNPTVDHVTIEVKDITTDATFILFDMLGRRIKIESLHKGINTIVIDELPAGTYMYSIRLANQQMSGKLIKQ